jgi:Tol biopolymer transport system component
VVSGYTNGCYRSVLVADGKRVAYIFNTLPLTIASLDGSVRSSVRAVHGTTSGWAYSPDRTRFAYLDGNTDRSDLTIVSLIDGSATVIARDLHDASLSWMSWSVDDTLAIGLKNGIQGSIDLIAADGTNRRPLVRKPLQSSDLGLMASWSPDGTRLAYTVVGPPGTPTGDTWVTDVATGRSIRVATADGQAVMAWAATANAPSFRWSPDGRQVAYGIGDNVALLDLATGDSRIVADPLWGAGPFWSPDGSRLALVSSGDSKRVSTFRADLSGRIDQTLEKGMRPIIAWSPDSRQIAVVSGSALYILDPDGLEPPVQISSNVLPDQGCLTWSAVTTP